MSGVTGALILALEVVSVLLSVTGFVARGPRSWLLLFSGAVLARACAVALRLWPLAAVDGACALFAAWMWWRRRKNKGRLRALASGKYRHVRDAMVATLRDRRVPRPALAPGRA